MQTPKQPFVLHLRRVSACFFLTLTLVAGGQSLVHGQPSPNANQYDEPPTFAGKLPRVSSTLTSGTTDFE